MVCSLLLLLTECSTSTSPCWLPFLAGGLDSWSSDGGGADGSREGRWSGAEQSAAPACSCLNLPQPIGVSTASCTQRKRQRCPGLSVLRSEFRKGSRWWLCHSTGMLSGPFQPCALHPALAARCPHSCRQHFLWKIYGQQQELCQPCQLSLSSVSSVPALFLGRAACAWCHIPTDSTSVTSPWLLLGVTSPTWPCCHIPMDGAWLGHIPMDSPDVTSPQTALVLLACGQPWCHMPMDTA